MIVAINIPLWIIPACFVAVIGVDWVWDDHRQRRRRRRDRERARRRMRLYE